MLENSYCSRHVIAVSTGLWTWLHMQSYWTFTMIIKPDAVDISLLLWRQQGRRGPSFTRSWTKRVILHTECFKPKPYIFNNTILLSYTLIFGQEQCIVASQSTCLVYKGIPRNTGHFIMFSVITNIFSMNTKGPTIMELFTATKKIDFFFWQLEMFDVCSTGDTAHIDTIFKFLPHTRQHGCIDNTQFQ